MTEPTFEQESLFGPTQSNAERTDEGTVTRRLPKARTVYDEAPVSRAVMLSRATRCQSCDARIVFVLARRKHNGEDRFGNHPVDLDADPAGTFHVIQKGRNLLAYLVPAADRKRRADLYVSHYATCPDADRWRGKGKRKR